MWSAGWGPISGLNFSSIIDYYIRLQHNGPITRQISWKLRFDWFVVNWLHVLDDSLSNRNIQDIEPRKNTVTDTKASLNETPYLILSCCFWCCPHFANWKNYDGWVWHFAVQVSFLYHLTTTTTILMSLALFGFWPEIVCLVSMLTSCLGPSYLTSTGCAFLKVWMDILHCQGMRS